MKPVSHPIGTIAQGLLAELNQLLNFFVQFHGFVPLACHLLFISDMLHDVVLFMQSYIVRLKVNVIVTNGPYSTRAAKAATFTIPIVMAAVGDPVGDGIVASLARPGGNITGLSSVAPELSGKRLELLKEIVPKLSRVAVFGSSTNPNTAGSLREVELAAGALKVKLQYLDVLSPKDIETAFRAAVKARAEAVLMMAAGGVVSAHRTEMSNLQ